VVLKCCSSFAFSSSRRGSCGWPGRDAHQPNFLRRRALRGRGNSVAGRSRRGCNSGVTPRVIANARTYVDHADVRLLVLLGFYESESKIFFSLKESETKSCARQIVRFRAGPRRVAAFVLPLGSRPGTSFLLLDRPVSWSMAACTR
jgi:hypothetical protein